MRRTNWANEVSGVALIDPKIDVYGKNGRTAALADLLEFRAIKGVSTSVADLADLIYEMGWTTKPTRLILIDVADDEDAAEPLAEQTFTLLETRREVLGERYPFEFKFGKLALKGTYDLRTSAYMALLAVSIAHAWDVPCKDAPEVVLEAIVAEALGQRLDSVELGTGDRAGRSFVDNLQAAANSVGLTASPDPLPREVYVKDAGVDTLVGHIWHDQRPGQWIMVGQVTCGRTDIWESKLLQPRCTHWRGYLQEPLTPQKFLAVPHHVDERFFYFLHSLDQGLVIDRLRLVLALDSGPSSASEVVSAVLLATAA